ncbi:MAG: HAMP domain-containing histidine kinase [Actinobacteria bacterium]|nr:HAMP domain-containing histidine kinase [Actinomycetota bacterium]
MIAFAVIMAVAIGSTAVAFALGLRRLPSLRLQLLALALLSTLLPLVGVLVGGLVMFDSRHDLIVLAVVAASSTVALGASLLIAATIMSTIERLQSAASGLARGELTSRASEAGPRELTELARSFNEMAGRLETLFDARRQLVAWASHDLRTPLASIQAMLEALEDGLAPMERYLPALQEQTHKLSSLVDDLFELARVDAGALTLELEETNLPELVRGCLRGVEAEAAARNITLQTRIQPVPAARCAPEQVERVLYNLLTNALRHTPSDGSVAVLLERLPKEVQVTVEDTGEGLPPGSAKRIFDRFWRADPARPSGRGSGAGLGLAIARGLVEAQGGRIWAEPRPGGGARISFTLPAAAGP